MKFFKNLFVLLTSVSVLCADGPLGFSKGSKPEDYKDLKKSENPWFYYSESSPSNNPYFNDFTLIFSKKSGLGKIIARTHGIESSDDGTEVMAVFNRIKDKLVEKYGKGEHVDFLKSGSVWTAPLHWRNGVIEKERIIVSYWEKGKDTSSLPDELDAVSLTVECRYGAKPVLILYYEFSNFDDVIKERKEIEKNDF